MSEEPRTIDVEATRVPAAAPAEAPARRSLPGTIGALLGTLLGGVYLLNPTLGVFELLPDNLPVVGNLDEAGATVLVLWALGYLLKGPGRGPLGPGGPRRP